jgi:superoxide dismutase, Fe-Mn family
LVLKSLGEFMNQVPYQLPSLPYAFEALEPIISAEIMKLHYSKHHQAYVNNLNTALEKYQEAQSRGDLAGMIAQEPAIRFNGGGHVNHSFFWTILTAPGKEGERPKGDLLRAIEKDYGSFEIFLEKFNADAIAIQGSGWAWLGYHKAEKKLKIATSPNQDPISLQGLIPIIGIDVWEHAYYLQYKNVRADYVKAFWKVINWSTVEQHFAKALA